jgi:hypothetical protein
MPDQASQPPEDLRALIEEVMFGDTLVFDPIPPGHENGLEACGKCGVCGQCGECVKGGDFKIDRDLDMLKRRIEVNPEILKDIKNRWDIKNTPH